MENKLDEFEMRDLLQQKRKEIKDLDDLIEFLKYVKENCNYDYGVAPRSIAQAALATSWYLSNEFGITGFQAGFVMWDFIRDWNFSNNKCGLKIIDYDDMLYPQYDYEFEKTISRETFKELQKQAEENLINEKYVHPNVVYHWLSIVGGKVPFGYKIKD